MGKPGEHRGAGRCSLSLQNSRALWTKQHQGPVCGATVSGTAVGKGKGRFSMGPSRPRQHLPMSGAFRLSLLGRSQEDC